MVNWPFRMPTTNASPSSASSSLGAVAGGVPSRTESLVGRIGLVTRVVPEGAAVESARETAELIVGNSPFGVRMTKEVMWANLDTPNMAACIALENRNQDIANRSSEVQDYMRGYADEVTG